jgi:3-oxoacyl-[acyl-carrier protein] reductase
MHNVIITGGTRGLGLGIVQRLAKSGFRPIAIARTAGEPFESAAQQAVAAGMASFEFVPFDLTQIDGIPEMVAMLHERFGRIYGLVNNAGTSTNGPLALTPTAKIEQVVRLNTLAPMVLTKYVVRSMMANGGGRIVNISSIAASAGYSGLSVYAGTKASLIGFTRSLAREVGRIGINVNAVAPGFLETEMTKELTVEQRQKIERRSALKRLAQVDDVADAVNFLLSNQSRSITGTVITVDAGNTA